MDSVDEPKAAMTPEEKDAVRRRAYHALKLVAEMTRLTNEAKQVALDLMEGTVDPKETAQRLLKVERAMRSGMSEPVQDVMMALYREDLRRNDTRLDEHTWIQRQNFALTRTTIEARERAEAEREEIVSLAPGR